MFVPEVEVIIPNRVTHAFPEECEEACVCVCTIIPIPWPGRLQEDLYHALPIRHTFPALCNNTMLKRNCLCGLLFPFWSALGGRPVCCAFAAVHLRRN